MIIFIYNNNIYCIIHGSSNTIQQRQHLCTSISYTSIQIVFGNILQTLRRRRFCIWSQFLKSSYEVKLFRWWFDFVGSHTTTYLFFKQKLGRKLLVDVNTPYYPLPGLCLIHSGLQRKNTMKQCGQISY